LQIARQLEVLDSFSSNNGVSTGEESELYMLDAAVAVVQHHDGVSGTSKQHVAFDYAKRLDIGFKKAASYVSGVLARSLLKDDPQGDAQASFQVCQDLNETVCEISSTSDDFFMVVYNGLSHTRSEGELIKLPVDGSFDYEVFDEDDNPVDSSISGGELYLFVNKEVPPMGTCIYRVKKLAGRLSSKQRKQSKSIKVIDNGKLTVTFCEKTGAIRTVNDREVSVDWAFYKSFVAPDDLPKKTQAAAIPNKHECLGNNIQIDEADDLKAPSDRRSSGAYLFVPSEADEKPEPYGIEGDAIFSFGGGVTTVESRFGNYIKQTARIYDNAEFIDFEYTIGPIDISDGVGKEVIMKFSTDINNDKVFYTDANAREFVKRKLNTKETYEYELFQPVAGNYYPVVGGIFIEDEFASMAVMSDRTHGGSSLNDGEIELMMMRRLLADDNYGVGEVLNETNAGMTPYPPYGDAVREGEGIVVSGVTRLAISNTGNDGARIARNSMEKMYSPLVPFFLPNLKSQTVSEVFKSHPITLVTENIPLQLSVVTLQRKGTEEGSFFIRVAHMYGMGDDEQLSLGAYIDLGEIVSGTSLVSFQELTLSGNQLRKDAEKTKMKWGDDGFAPKYDAKDEGSKIFLEAMDVRTFRVVLREI